VNRQAGEFRPGDHHRVPALEIVLFVVAVVLLLGGPFMRTSILRRTPDRATNSRFLSYRWAALTAGVCAVLLVVLLVRNGGFH
jgi:hypothetical protein